MTIYDHIIKIEFFIIYFILFILFIYSIKIAFVIITHWFFMDFITYSSKTLAYIISTPGMLSYIFKRIFIIFTLCFSSYIFFTFSVKFIKIIRNSQSSFIDKFFMELCKKLKLILIRKHRFRLKIICPYKNRIAQ